MGEQQVKSRTTLEVGLVTSLLVFAVGVAFNSGIQYGQVHALAETSASHSVMIRQLQIDVAAQNNQTNASLARIEANVQDMMAAQELRSTGAAR